MSLESNRERLEAALKVDSIQRLITVKDCNLVYVVLVRRDHMMSR
jgi:hypothetical protein